MMDFNRILNPKFILHLLLRFWYVLVISVIASVVLANLYLRITPQIYSSVVMVEVADKSSGSGIQNALSEVSMFGELKNLENEIRAIKSFPLILETIKHLDFNVSYFVEGDIKKRELYGSTPFKILIYII